MRKALRAQRGDNAVDSIEGGVLAGEHEVGVWAGAGFHEIRLWGTIGEGGGYFCGGGETAAAVWVGGCGGGVKIEGLEDGGVEVHFWGLF